MSTSDQRKQRRAKAKTKNATARVVANASAHVTSSKERTALRKELRMNLRRTEIVATTRKLLEDEGPSALSASRISSECALTTSGLYHYFDNLEALLAAVHIDLFKEELRMSQAALFAVVEDGDDCPRGFQLISAIFRAKISFGIDNPKRWRALYQGAAGFPTTSPIIRDALIPLAQGFFEEVNAFLSEDLEVGFLHHEANPRLLANLAFCQAQGVLTLYMAAEAAGTDTHFPINLLVDTALETFRRAWWTEAARRAEEEVVPMLD